MEGKGIDGTEGSNLLFRKNGKSINYYYLGTKLDFKNGYETTIPSLTRIDVLMLLFAKYGGEDKVKDNTGRKGLQRLYAADKAKYLPLAIEILLSNARGVLKMEKDNEELNKNTTKIYK